MIIKQIGIKKKDLLNPEKARPIYENLVQFGLGTCEDNDSVQDCSTARMQEHDHDHDHHDPHHDHHIKEQKDQIFGHLTEAMSS